MIKTFVFDNKTNYKADNTELTLPKLIFCENHQDPITPMLLNKLLPELKKLGYKSFLDEMPAGTWLEYHFEDYKNTLLLWNALCSKLCIENSDDNKAYSIISFITQGSLYFVEMFMHNKSFFEFYKALFESGLSYLPIDSAVIKRIMKDYDVTSNGIRNYRDNLIANEYLINQDSFFSRIGLLHSQGVQTCIINSHVYNSLEDAKEDYLFIYPFSKKAIEGELPFRNGKVECPLNIISLDITNTDEIETNVEKILNLIKAKMVAKKQKNIDALASIKEWLNIYRKAEEKVHHFEFPIHNLWSITDKAVLKNFLENTKSSPSRSGFFYNSTTEEFSDNNSRDFATMITQEACDRAEIMETEFKKYSL